jgi:RimJ/RimL family protein N-acetyltransferase
VGRSPRVGGAPRVKNGEGSNVHLRARQAVRAPLRRHPRGKPAREFARAKLAPKSAGRRFCGTHLRRQPFLFGDRRPPLFVEFHKRVTDEDLRLRFFAPVRDFSHAFLARLIQIDYARAIAFVALDPGTGEMMGVVRLHADANHETGEYAILLRSDLKGVGLGRELMRLMIEWAKAEGLSTVEGQELRENPTCLIFVAASGSRRAPIPEIRTSGS